MALDGYLGDVIQRGVYMTYGGKSGEFFKLFPFLTTLILSDKYILRSRYSKLTDKQFEILWYDYTARTRSVEGLSNLQKITYYEFLFGRGLRYISTGGLVMNSTFKSVFPVFASRKIFSTLIHQKDADVLNYKVFNRVWRNAPAFARKIKSEGFYSPKTTPFLIPFYNFIGRLMTNFHPKYLNYTKK